MLSRTVPDDVAQRLTWHRQHHQQQVGGESVSPAPGRCSRWPNHRSWSGPHDTVRRRRAAQNLVGNGGAGRRHAGVAGVDAATGFVCASVLEPRNRKCSAAMVRSAAGLVVRDGGRAAQGANRRTLLSRVVLRSQLGQPEPVAHRQRHFQPTRRGNDHVDPVGKV